MKVRWTHRARRDVYGIVDYIMERNPPAARRIQGAILERTNRILSTQPRSGREGRSAGTRELILAPLQWIVIYQVTDTCVEVLRVWSGHQQWPEADMALLHAEQWP